MSGPTKAQYLAAARLIEERGWKRWGGAGPKGQRCMMLTMADVGIRSTRTHQFECTFIIKFNDEPGRTKAEVLSALLGLAEVAP